MTTAKIYALQSKGVIRYVGKTTDTLANRLKGHLNEAQGKKRSHRLNWLRSLKEPPIIVLLIYAPLDDWPAAESYWITLARDWGCRLVNGNDGGRGGNNPTPETREKQAAIRRGKPRNRADIEKMVATKLRRGLERALPNRSVRHYQTQAWSDAKEDHYQKLVRGKCRHYQT